MRTYEAVFILDDRRYEDGGEAFAKDVVNLIEQLGGRLLERNPMGRRQFARPIRKRNSGIYWDFILDMSPEKVAAFKERYRLDETVFRLQVMSYDAPPGKKIPGETSA